MQTTSVPAKALAAIIFLLTLAGAVTAQPGLDEFREVRREVNQWYYGMSDLVLALGAVTGIIGGARVYSNWQAGRRNIEQEVMGWFFACLFLSMTGAVLKGLYGVD